MGVICFITSIVEFCKRFINSKTTEIILTNKRCVLKTGLIDRCSADLLLDKCDCILYYDNFMGRRLGYGTIAAKTSSMSISCCGIAEPNIFRNILNEQIELYKKNLN